METEQRIDHTARSNNNDRDKIVATVASTVIDFIKHYPEASIFAKGSTPARTRLYQSGILSNWYEINQLLIIEGFIDDDWQPFEKHRNYQAFLVKAK